jgi:hypothetical protein
MAAAQDDGVFFDPGGPSDKEYAVPHEQARGGGDAPLSDENGGSGGALPSGGSGTEAGAGGDGALSAEVPEAALFGEGVTRSEQNRNAVGQAPDRSDGEGVVGVSPVSAETSLTSGIGWLVLIAAGVVLAGAGLAFLFNARARRPSS